MTDLPPPYAREAEQEVLSACIISPEIIPVALAMLSAEDFYVAEHKLAFKAIERLTDVGIAVDLVTAAQQVRDFGRDDAVSIVSRILDRRGSSYSVPHYAKMVREKRVRRDLMDAANKLCIEAATVSDEAGIDAALDRIRDLETWRREMNRPKSQDLKAAGERFWAYVDGEVTTRKVARTGIPALDDYLPAGGFPSGTLTIGMAPPGTGKTMFALGNVARSALEDGERVLYVAPADGGNDRLFRRLVSGVAKVSSRRIDRHELTSLERGAVTAAIERVAKWPFFEERLVSVIDIVDRARQLHRDGGLGLIVVDYLQRIHNGMREQWADLAYTSAALADLALELEVPVLALSQPSTDARRQGGPLKAAHMKGSGAMEEDADLVLTLLRAPAKDAQGRWPGGLEILKGRDVEPVCWPAVEVAGPMGRTPACGWVWNYLAMRLEER